MPTFIIASSKEQRPVKGYNRIASYPGGYEAILLYTKIFIFYIMELRIYY